MNGYQVKGTYIYGAGGAGPKYLDFAKNTNGGYRFFTTDINIAFEYREAVQNNLPDHIGKVIEAISV